MPETVPRRRRSIRLPGFDYSLAGDYFVTLCTYGRVCALSIATGQDMKLNADGRVVAEDWAKTTSLRPEVRLGQFVIMPNHLHALVSIVAAAEEPTHAETDAAASVGAHGRAPLHRAPKSLGSMIAGFKAATTKRINNRRGTPGAPVWQRNYYERIIRNEAEYYRIAQYIVENPARWMDDEYYPKAPTQHPSAVRP
jgi:REP element-mobilizing transposase RayT